MSFRTKGINSLSNVLTIEKNIKTIEELIYNISYKDTNSIDLYNEYIYQVIGDICSKKYTMKIMECNKCNSKKVISYSKQTRGGDESTTVYCTCVNPKCGFKWTC